MLPVTVVDVLGPPLFQSPEIRKLLHSGRFHWSQECRGSPGRASAFVSRQTSSVLSRLLLHVTEVMLQQLSVKSQNGTHELSMQNILAKT